ncbi:NAD(P)/FAD-dependent oxidoreductase [Piscinibacter koreensis]|uniref:NAD(P)/FAD-dependent oxidoreductase n=1 Tax=Piscinibacter koreensis TaxID=2742824 RepID=A0A7Y6TYH6_9BURK|nr:NAD(P)/FAD-dependent oxidoreductase [Schlegelella koreensis]NUZ08106.1 NAD(P)/FAD-dependent oxidoreductase [Schlegelella koreensis]
MLTFDAVVIGAGAAGLHAAALAGQRGLAVLLLDHAAKLAEKIRISGGGRCNFTNRDVSAANFASANPDFCRSALARYTPQDFIALVERHRIAWHEKHKGQLFCDRSSQQIIDMLAEECRRGGVELWQPCRVEAVRHESGGFVVDSERGSIAAPQPVVATGGLSIPQIGASDIGYRLARQFGHRIVDTRPALVPLTVKGDAWAPYAGLAGVAVPADVHVESDAGQARFVEDLLFTHRGLSGPAALQISTFWRPGVPLAIDLLPGEDLAALLRRVKQDEPRRKLASVLAERLPRRVAEVLLAGVAHVERPLADWRDRDLASEARRLQHLELVPDGTEGYRKAEVTSGGVDTRQLDSRTMRSKLVPGLAFIGEVADVTGWLGGYNFQWAWASAAACARGLERRVG